jgi:hypothetical protein
VTVCKDILSFSGNRPGANKYGLYFDFGLLNTPTRFSNALTYAFQDLGPRRVRLMAENWEGVLLDISDWKIQVN